ncbi:MAG: hypothetical protein ACTHWZ_03820 [Peptoniphilaceae bacterium]
MKLRLPTPTMASIEFIKFDTASVCAITPNDILAIIPVSIVVIIY